MTNPQTTAARTSSTESEIEPATEQLTVDGKPVTVLGMEIDISNRTVVFEDGKLTYPAGIGGEIRAVAPAYKEVTQAFEEQFPEYRFHEEGEENAPWFHTAEFWPYTTIGDTNLFNDITFSTTHPRDTSIRLQGIDRSELSYPFSEKQVLAFRDPDTGDVRAFAGGTDAKPVGDVARRVFQPTLNLYAAHEGDLLLFAIRAKPYTTPENENDDSTTDIRPGHIDHGRRARFQTTNIVWENTEHKLSGPVRQAMDELSRERFMFIRPDSFDSVRQMVVSSELTFDESHIAPYTER